MWNGHFHNRWTSIFKHKSKGFLVRSTQPIRKVCFVFYIAHSICDSLHGILCPAL